jgi:hypothetical protein
MATTTYESLIPEIIPIVASCPDSMIQQHIRSTVIDLCERSAIYQKELDPITVSRDVYEYDFDPPSGTVVHKIEWAIFDGDVLEPVTSGLLEQREPDWRNSTGTPEYVIKNTQDTFLIIPIPSTAKTNGLIIRACLKPTHTSTSCDSTVMSDYRDAIVNGTLFRLLRIPSKDWTDYNAASVYSALYNEGIGTAEKRARYGDTAVAGKVNYGGLYSNRRSVKKYAGKRTFY